ncbi:unnamed protein product [Oikopleura dioica]|uniref:Uncharacterized protein n=1 Tax=Oikopleura dioica TaxID=34765 RepID=E4WXA1_OIKDI|nr:unnamed protein product [Oikopleura dioica]
MLEQTSSRVSTTTRWLIGISSNAIWSAPLASPMNFTKTSFKSISEDLTALAFAWPTSKPTSKRATRRPPSMMTIAKRFWNDSSTAKIQDSKRFSSVNSLNSRSRMRRRERLKSRSRFHHPRICLWQTLNKPKIQLYQSYVRCSRIR